MQECGPLLFEQYPEARSLPWTSIVNRPTPVRRLTEFGRALGGAEIWIKDDSRTSPLYGGNKPRKLEFLLADALRLGAKRVMTAGALGSNHCLATLLHARRLELETSLLLFPQRVSQDALRKLLAFRFYGAGMQLVKEFDRLKAARQAFSLALEHEEGAAPYWIPLGGSNPIGTLGFADAALELADQIAREELPLPERIYVTAGSSGTLAGLALGLRLARLKTRLVGVLVRPAGADYVETILNYANGAADLLRAAGCHLEISRVRGADFKTARDYFGEGYAIPTHEGREAVALMEQTEGIRLDNTYTGKALSALIAAARSAPASGPILFWNTYDAIAYWTATEGHVTRDDLPAEFHPFFDAPEDESRQQ